MAKRQVPKEVYLETENSDKEFSFDLLQIDSDIESDNVGSDSDNDIILLKQRVRQSVIDKNSQQEENENSSMNEFTT